MKFSSSFVRAGLVLLMAAAAATGANATAVTFFGDNPTAASTVVDGVGAGKDPVNQRNLFKNSLASFQTEAFNMAATTNTSSLSDLFAAGSGVTLTSTDANANATSRIQNNPLPNGGPATGRFNTTGDPTVAATGVGSSAWFETNKSATTIQFSTAVQSFGTFITDVGDFKGALSVEVFNGSTSLYSSSLIGTGSGSTAQGGLAFFGYLNDTVSFTKVVFTLTQFSAFVGQYDSIGFDDFITGPVKTSNVPEPTSLALVGLALTAAGFAARRRRA